MKNSIVPRCGLVHQYAEVNEHVPHINKYVPDMGSGLSGFISRLAEGRQRREEQALPRRREADRDKGGTREKQKREWREVDTEEGKAKIG